MPAPSVVHIPDNSQVQIRQYYELTLTDSWARSTVSRILVLAVVPETGAFGREKSTTPCTATSGERTRNPIPGERGAGITAGTRPTVPVWPQDAPMKGVDEQTGEYRKCIVDVTLGGGGEGGRTPEEGGESETG